MTTERVTLSKEHRAALPETFIHVSRRKFRLTYYSRLAAFSTEFTRISSHRIAIGAILHETPPGVYVIQEKARHPDWQMPFSDWVPVEQQGKVIPGDSPDNPIREAFIKLTDDGIGIHGTDSLWSLGSKASHGCIRVTPQVAVYLYNRVAPGDTVWIS